LPPSDIREGLAHLDRLAIRGSVVEPRPVRRRRVGSNAGLLVLFAAGLVGFCGMVCAIGAAMGAL
jgi:hypothetical protein